MDYYETTLLWTLVFHDAVYDTHSTGNEDKSAELAYQQLHGKFSEAGLATVQRLIKLTKTHQPAPHDTLGQIVCDIDLAILGAPTGHYVQYVMGVRREYEWVDNAAWSEGRKKVLEDFLGRSFIYWTDPFLELEGRARHNLYNEWSTL